MRRETILNTDCIPKSSTSMQSQCHQQMGNCLICCRPMAVFQLSSPPIIKVEHLYYLAAYGR